MFAKVYEGDDARAQHGDSLVNTNADGCNSPRVLVADSDNDDSLGFPPHASLTSALTTPVPPSPRAFSKRAAKCAAELLHQCDTAPSAAQKERCLEQLRRLGGAYRPLCQGQPLTVWVKYADLNARVIRETEAYFDGKLKERFGAPQITRRNGSLSASPKPAVQVTTGTASTSPCGVRSPLPGSGGLTHRDGDNFSLSCGEQFALSMLAMDEDGDSGAKRQPIPTYLLRKDAHGELQRVSISNAMLSTQGSGANTATNVFSTTTAPSRGPLFSPSPCWVYDEVEDGLSSVQSTPSAAHSTESPGAAPAPRKRSRTADDAAVVKRVRDSGSGSVARRLPFDDPSFLSSQSKEADEEASVQGFSVASSTFATPKSLSATVIERQNHRVQWDLFRHPSLFSPF